MPKRGETTRKVKRPSFWEQDADAAPEAAATREVQPAAAQTFEAGEKLGRFTVTSLLGAGGAGHVYACTDAVGHKRAIKVLAPAADDPDEARRLEAEALLLARVQSPFVIQVEAVDHLPDGRPYLVLPLLEGQTLARRLLERGPFTWATLRPLLVQALEALHAIHSVGLVHRDVKPENFVLSKARPPHLTLIDFGIARQAHAPGAAVPPTHTSLVRGTLEYMSPEQLLGEPVGPKSDLYSLGCTAWELLTESQPFPGAPRERTVAQRPPDLSERAPKLPKDAAAFVMRLLARHPEQRFSSAMAASRALG